MPGADVLVVGAGPTGLTLACTLAASGVPCRLVDRRTGQGTEPKALVLWSGALEVLRRLGVSRDVVAEALPLSGASYWASGRKICSIPFGGLQDTAFPGPLCLPQPAVERLLHRRLLELGGTVEWGTELVDVDHAPGEARVVLRSSAGGTERIAVPWLVGADGTRSRVRSALGLRFEGRTYEREFLLGDGVLSGRTSRDEAQYHLSPEGVLVVVPLPDGGHRVFADAEPGPDAPAPDVALLQRLLDRRGPGHLHLDRTWWTSRFRVHAKVASAFRSGPGFLAGDAAHCHSPAGGQGLNTGVQDGFDLGWKLAAVIRGADAALLDSYEAERRPVALRAVRAADLQTRLWLLRSSFARQSRDAAMAGLARAGVLERGLVPQLAQLDLDLSGSPAVADLPGAGVAPRPVRTGRRLPLGELRPSSGAGTRGGVSARHLLVLVGPELGGLAASTASTLRERGIADLVGVVHVLPGPGPGPARGAGPRAARHAVLHDDGRLYAGRSWVASVRPDGVVGARAGVGGLEGLLDRLPRRAVVGALR